MIESITENLNICGAKSSEIAVWNESLNEPAKLTKYRSLFYSLWQDDTVDDVIRNLMSIKELLQLAKNTPITTDQIRQIRARLEKQGKQEAETSATNSNGLLSRTYSL